ncbi:heterokaryon incompatibility protein-domain-containing protein [Xylariomycetidae sp. FL2044]|nr:heterokaryon incompatibility protein-domain-containing protein [Xylariomycetidae sp. FL2044]
MKFQDFKLPIFVSVRLNQWPRATKVLQPSPSRPQSPKPINSNALHIMSESAFDISVGGLDSEEPQVMEPIRSHSIYDSTRLDKSQMRLLQLRPGPLQDPVSCRLVTVDSRTLRRKDLDVITPDETYDALSYVWQSDEEDTVIFVNDVQFRVSANLNHALRCLRMPDNSRVLWVDAICINQDDVAEKTDQVCMMDRIFRNAETVLIYLGPEADESSIVMDYLTVDDRELLNDDGELFTAPGERTSIAERRPFRSQFEHEDTFLATYFAARGFDEDRVAEAAYAFFCRPWWTRMWVIQEAKLASRDPVWFCGQHSTTTQRLRERLLALHNFTMHKKQPSYVLWQEGHDANARGRRKPYEDLMSWTKAVESVFFTLDPVIIDVSNMSLSRWLELCIPRKSTDPRDRIFALVSMLGGTARYHLAPDYAMPTGRVFHLATAYVLIIDRQTQLFYLYSFTREAGPPSWSLDFARAIPGLIANEWFKEYDSAYWSNRPLQFETGPRSVIMTGIDFDEIDAVSNISPGASALELLRIQLQRRAVLLRTQRLLPRVKPCESRWLPLVAPLPHTDFHAGNSHITSPEGLDQEYIDLLQLMVRSKEELPGAVHFMCEVLHALAAHVAAFAKEARCDDAQQSREPPLTGGAHHRAYLRAAITTMSEQFLEDALFHLSELKSSIREFQFTDITTGAGEPRPAVIDILVSGSPLDAWFCRAQSTGELDVMKTLAGEMTDLCHSTTRRHVNEETISPLEDIDKVQSRLFSVYADATTALREAISHCKSEEKRGRLETYYHALLQEVLMFQHVIPFLKKQRNAEAAALEALGFVRERTALFLTGSMLLGQSFQQDPGFESGDKLVLMNGFQCPLILKEVDGGGKFRIKGAAHVGGLMQVDIESLIMDGILQEEQFEII